MTIDQQIDKAALELVHELISAREGEPWFFIVRRKMAACRGFAESTFQWRLIAQLSMAAINVGVAILAPSSLHDAIGWFLFGLLLWDSRVCRNKTS